MSYIDFDFVDYRANAIHGSAALANAIRRVQGVRELPVPRVRHRPRTIQRPKAVETCCPSCGKPYNLGQVSAIQNIVAAHYKIDPQEMISSRRSRKVARPRQVAMFFAREFTPKSFPEIGRWFGNKDHTTILHGVRKVESLIKADPAFAVEIEMLRERLAA